METTELPVVDEAGRVHPDRSSDPQPMVGPHGRHAWANPVQCMLNGCKFAPRSDLA
jgi:hypothetical protein